ncbi:unnamed protein product [Didymodactylos carnosus]|uniref:RNA-dependent RNA polymerase n=1 Tax=Didymodactylos carnosus TaxID=1234261 RepID=A0A814N411_9BILA|nr:unnamed protein product [Didymodactylos carnosus]CAF1327229.1 unnamed protein product [Didymodactylos carnosus]CAF3853498.1 unnamed protein product [Didymodactylos carnosus]CAF4138668.1 unnamed protein product [Didymodactylos carnosus]
MSNSFTDILSKSSDLLLQFDPPSDAWLFLLALPLVGHTNKNKRQDGNFKITFASFTLKNWSFNNNSVKNTFTSFKSQYSMEMVQSLGYVFTDKYMNSSDVQESFKTIERRSTHEFYEFCCLIQTHLKENHCLYFKDLAIMNNGNKNGSISTSIRMTSGDNQLFLIRCAVLTPMRLTFKSLNPEIGNRAVRLRGSDNFIRVYIRDENDEIFDTLDVNIRSRFKSKLFTNGITCMNRVYYCLASSTSQMKDFSYWFIALNDGETTDQVLMQYGDFSGIKNLATYVARTENGYCFTDGCGLISLGLAQEVAEKIGLPVKQPRDIPSVFQIRMAGCKGVLVIDPESRDTDYYIKIRDSMVKFLSNDWTLDICDYSRPVPLALNNQVIRLFSDLGNGFDVFESLHIGFFFLDLCSKENLLRNKIPLPVNEARNLFGVADPTGLLKPGQCFIQYTVISKAKKKTYKVVKGTVLVTKNPCLYPGDIRKLEAVDVLILRHCSRDCIVFPVTGSRPHSDEISGSDLDGDQYWVYWGNDLKINHPIEPLSHSSAEKLTVPNITNEMVIDYYLDMFQSKWYSLIADVHMVLSDKMEQGTQSKECVELATLFYRAIDSPKTGEIINMDKVFRWRDEYCTSYPKFMMKFDRPYYPSTSIPEKLYLNAKSIELGRKENYERYQTTGTHQNRVSTSNMNNVVLEHVQPSSLLQHLL